MNDYQGNSARRVAARLGLVVVAAVAALVTALTVQGFTRGAPAASSGPSLREAVMKHERLIAACMHQHGFSYVVAVPADLIIQEAKLRAEATPGAPTATPSTSPDPNDAILAALTPTRQSAYQLAYWGDGTANPGCYYSTYAQAWGSSADQVVESGDRLVARVEHDPRVVRARTAYITCMRKHGLTVTDTDTVDQLVDDVREGPGAQNVKDRTVASMQAADNACGAPYNDVYNKVYLELSD